MGAGEIYLLAKSISSRKQRSQSRHGMGPLVGARVRPVHDLECLLAFPDTRAGVVRIQRRGRGASALGSLRASKIEEHDGTLRRLPNVGRRGSALSSQRIRALVEASQWCGHAASGSEAALDACRSRTAATPRCHRFRVLCNVSSSAAASWPLQDVLFTAPRSSVLPAFTSWVFASAKGAHVSSLRLAPTSTNGAAASRWGSVAFDHRASALSMAGNGTDAYPQG